ncbi:hypothetical protein C8J31_11440 [Rhizobium sp. PP-CC-2G-626]|nr:hypothetical protein C8J31_11440 [Rhizobium sp. PP-CC-2G-626]
MMAQAAPLETIANFWFAPRDFSSERHDPPTPRFPEASGLGHKTQRLMTKDVACPCQATCQQSGLFSIGRPQSGRRFAAGHQALPSTAFFCERRLGKRGIGMLYGGRRKSWQHCFVDDAQQILVFVMCVMRRPPASDPFLKLTYPALKVHGNIPWLNAAPNNLSLSRKPQAAA